MNIIKKIINFWKKREQKALPEAQVQNNYANMNKNRNWMLTNNSYNQPTKIDMEIDSFLNLYSNMIENADITQPIDTRKMAYRALVSMNGKPVTQEEYNKNFYKEQMLLSQLNNNSQYKVQAQNTSNGTAFYHVRSYNHRLPKNEDIVRLYINCNNGNIAELSNLILACNQNPNFYMKFAANDSNVINSRGEKIVIYCDKNEVNSTMELIQNTKNMRPDLYKESENLLPFLQNINNTVSVAKQPLTDQFKDLKGNYKTIPQSTNSFISCTLQESYMEAVKEIARSDTNLSFLLQNDCLNNEYLYMRNYPYINSKYHDYLLQSMEAKMAILSKNNDIDIEGIPKQYQQDSEYGQKNNQNEYYRQ